MNGNALVAQPWSLALGELGKAFLVASVLMYLTACVRSFMGAKGGGWFLAGAFGFIGAFVSLVVLFLKHQFQYKYVFQHSALNHETQYLVAGAWAGQEGSFLLWGLTSAVLCALAVRKAGVYSRWFVVVCSFVLASIAAILTVESPFSLLPLVDGRQLIPVDGRGLAPSLLNYWVVIHPPTIFIGFSLLTVLFGYAMSAVLTKDVCNWLPLVRPWAILNLAVLGLGLCMGGFWAYETLGWGGFWAWDPVENTSFVPWCIVIAFVHGIFVQKAKGKWRFANVVFAGLPFLLFCYGTFLTRSGFLGDTSVHSFAEMDRRALWLLIAIMAVSMLSFIVTLATNWSVFKPAPPPQEARALPISREPLYGTGIWLLFFFATVTALGMSYPLIVSLVSGKPKVVEEGLYHDVLAWAFPLFMLVMAMAPFVGWKGLRFRDLIGKTVNCLAISIGLIGCILLWMKSPGFVAPKPDQTIHLEPFHIEAPVVSWVLFLVWLCLFTAIASFWRMMEAVMRSRSTVWAMLTHFGLAMALLGLVFSRGFEQKVQVVVHKKETANAFDFSLAEKGQTSQFSDRNNKIKVEAESKDLKFTATPGLYFVPGSDGQPAPMIWPYVQNTGLIDYYFTIFQPVFEATGATEMPLSSDPDKPTSRAYKNMVLLYHGFKSVGQMGAEDTALIAQVTVVSAEGSQEIEPAILITKDRQIVPMEARVGKDYKVKLVKIDPDTKAATIQIMYVDPAYPLEVYFKPLTLFVWLGVGIMTLGGLLSALYRRKELLGNQTDAPEPSP